MSCLITLKISEDGKISQSTIEGVSVALKVELKAPVSVSKKENCYTFSFDEKQVIFTAAVFQAINNKYPVVGLVKEVKGGVSVTFSNFNISVSSDFWALIQCKIVGSKDIIERNVIRIP